MSDVESCDENQTTSKRMRAIYTKWSTIESEKIHDFFKRWICEDRNGLPVKRDCLKFKELHPEFCHEWIKIRNKVMSLQTAFGKHKGLRLVQIHHDVAGTHSNPPWCRWR
jgi:hypothetical protein